ncbi:MAG: BlaI/MecI/CopY family transcriptional regulator [Lachnospiraceae bacterium]
MKKTRFELSIKEQEIMELFWNSEDGLTSVDIYEQLRDSVLNSTYVHRALNTLIDKNLIEECGSIRYNKQYARKFKAVYTKEEYAANLLNEKGLHLNSLKGIATAFIKQSNYDNSYTKAEIINELKLLIDEIDKGE